VGAVNALARVQLPAYARFDARDPELYRAVVAVTRTALVVGGAMLVVLATGARAIVPAVYAPRWVASVPVVWGLLPNMAGGLIVGPLFTMLQAQGRAGLALRAFLVWTLATWALVLAVRGEGLGAIAAAHGVVTVAMTLWLVAWAGRHLARPLWREYAGPTLAGVGAVVGAELAAWRWGAAHPERAGWWVAALALVLYVTTLVMVDGTRTRANLAALRVVLRRAR
jgi:O-antigen/teichoic acid export membrane protein